METMQPALKNGRNVWDSINMPKEEFESRIKLLRSAMAARGLDLLLVYTTGLSDYGDTAYLVNFITRLPRGTLVAVPQKGEIATFFEGSSRGLPSLKLTLAMGELVAVGDLAKESARYLREKGLVPGAVGLVGLKRNMPYQYFRSLMSQLNDCAVSDSDGLIADFRTVKSVRETDQIRRSGRIMGQIIHVLKEEDFEHAKERLVEAALYRTARFSGAEDFRMLMAKPGHPGQFLRPTEDAGMAEGEKAVFYLAVEFERYWAEAIRTLVFRRGRFVEDDDDGALAAFQKLCGVIKPGVEISTLHREALTLLGQGGIDVLSPYGLGNGLGLGLCEAPFLSAEAQGEFKEGMVVSLRTAVSSSDGSYSVFGNTVLVGSDGGLVLTVEPTRPVE